MTRKDWSLLILLSLLWGGSFLCVELALRGLPPLSIVWGRVSVAAMLLGLTLVLSRKSRPVARFTVPRKAVLIALLVMGLLNNVLPFTLFVLAQGRIDSALAAIVNATTPLWTLAAAHLFTSDEKINPAKALGLGFGFAGVAVLAGRGGGGEGIAILACLGAALSYGLAAVWGRRFRRYGLPPLTTAFGQTAAATLILLPIWLTLDQPWSLPAPGLNPVLAVLAMAALCTALAYLIYFRLLASAGATNLSLVTFLIPLSAAAMGVVVLGEQIHPRHLIGFILISAGLLAIDGRLIRRFSAKAGAQ